MREEAAENKLLQLLRERDRVSEEKVELKPRPKRKKVTRKPAKSSPVREQIELLNKIFHTPEPSSKYTKIQNAFYDSLAKELSLSEQSIYHYLYRLSFGHHKRICIVGYNALSKATGIKSRETIRMAVSGLVDKGYVSVIGDVGPKGSIYFVYLPEEIDNAVSRGEILKTNVNGSTLPANSILKNGILNISILHFDTLTLLKNSIPKNGTIPEVPIKTEKTATIPKNSILNFGAHINKEINNKEKLSLKKMGECLVNKLYEKLNSRASSEKKLRGYEEAEKLLSSYTPEEIQYTIDWAIKNIPDIRSFALIPHVIDQALKAKNNQEQQSEAKKIAIQRAKEQEERERRESELQKKVSEVKKNLNKKELARIHQEAESIVRGQIRNKKFGQDILVRLKENEIIRELYLSRPY